MSFLSQIIFVVLLLGGLMGAFLFLQGKGRIYWLITMGGCLSSVVLMEGISKITTGMTISQHFWQWSLNHEMTAWLVLGMLLIGWLVLLHHLALKIITRRFGKK